MVYLEREEPNVFSDVDSKTGEQDMKRMRTLFAIVAALSIGIIGAAVTLPTAEAACSGKYCDTTTECVGDDEYIYIHTCQDINGVPLGCSCQIGGVVINLGVCA